jgi:hypothetical protein
MRLIAIACEVFFREASAAAARSPHIVDLAFMPKSLHDIGEGPMSARLQAAIDQALAARSPEPRTDAIVLLYGLCNNGIRGLRAPVPLVAPRAHDCITLLLGSRARYQAHFEACPGTFYQSPGWIERDSDPEANPASVTSRMGISHDHAKLAARYGEDNAAYLMEAMGDWFRSYRRLSFIDTGVGDAAGYRRTCQARARDQGWDYEELAGDTGLIDRLLGGDWDPQDFLVVPPGRTLAPSLDGSIITTAD